MWSWLAKLFIDLPGIADKLFDYLGKKTDANVLKNQAGITGDIAVNQAALTAYIEERKVIAAEKAKLSESLWTVWMIPTAFLFAIAHFAAIVLDSMLHLGWAIAKLPAPYDQLQWTIIGSVIGVSGISGVIRRVFK